jgi:hypothetical protein
LKKTRAFLTEHPFFIFLSFLLLAYLPVFLPFFHTKNDLITQNLPTRFIISESLWSGYFPWWNPYINFGLPQYGDMNGGYWNPLLWLIARVFGYGIWSITLEEMFYILMGAWGIYLLCKEQQASRETAIITGLSYMCCGYILGHLQHFCWITGTATFPFVLLSFIRIHKYSLLKNYIAGGISVFFFVASTHPGLIIGALYLFLFIIPAIYLLRKEIFSTLYHPKYWLANGLFLAISLLFSLVVIVSNLDVLKHISRGSKVSLEQSLLHPTTFPSYLSLLFPLAVQKSGLFHTDISMRNTYIGITLLCGFILFCLKMKRKTVLITLSCLIFFILLSSGGLFKTFAWHFLPYTGYVRLNGEFNYFVLLILLLAGAAGFELYRGNIRYLQESDQLARRLNYFFLTALILSACVILFGHSSILYETASPAKGSKERIKWVIDHLSFSDMLFLQSVIQLVTLACIRKYNFTISSLVIVTALNLVITCWLILPYTGLGMSSKANRQELISRFPKGIRPPEQKALNATFYLDSSYTKDLILLGSYSKKIGYVKEEAYPVELNTTTTFFNDPQLFSFIRQQSWLFLSKDTIVGTATDFDSSRIHILQFGPGRLQASVDNKDYHYLTFLQNDYPYWKVIVNGESIPHITGFGTFITIPLQQGRQKVEFCFDPVPIRTALIIHLLILASGLLLLWNKRTRNLPIFKRIIS